MKWRSEKQNFIARCSAEVEFKGLWLQKLFEELYTIVDFPIKLYCDHKEAININLNPVQHDKAKHVEVNRHFIK